MRLAALSSALAPAHRRDTLPHMFFPLAIAFLAGLCIMVVELLAGNVIAGFLGQSLHTWTTVIGAIMCGMIGGNYLGGMLADRTRAGRTLGVVFILAAVACAAIGPMNGWIGRTLDGMDVSPRRIVLHVFVVFFIPGGLLGMISPVVAKIALDTGRATGQTVGSVYACNAAGSIAGTFLTGFMLIPHFRTSHTIWAVAGVLLLLGAACLAVGGRQRFGTDSQSVRTPGG